MSKFLNFVLAAVVLFGMSSCGAALTQDQQDALSLQDALATGKTELVNQLTEKLSSKVDSLDGKYLAIVGVGLAKVAESTPECPKGYEKALEVMKKAVAKDAAATNVVCSVLKLGTAEEFVGGLSDKWAEVLAVANAKAAEEEAAACCTEGEEGKECEAKCEGEATEEVAE